MRTRTMVLAFAVSTVGADAAFTATVHMGSWKLNEASSKIDAGATKNTTVVYASAGDNVKITVDGVDGPSKPVHTEWTGKFDGKPYPVTGNPAADTRAYTKVSNRTLSFVEKKGATVTNSGRAVVSADGKHRTVTSTATDSTGKKLNTRAVYDKQ
jgi:hypothetical protein